MDCFGGFFNCIKWGDSSIRNGATLVLKGFNQCNKELRKIAFPFYRGFGVWKDRNDGNDFF